jgi:hypothetical protein
MHIHNGDNLQGLLYITYGFHVTLITAGLVLAYSLLTLLRPGDADVQAGGAATDRARSVGPRQSLRGGSHARR